MVRPSASAILAAMCALTRVASAWSIAFYTGENCSRDASYNSSMYEGTGSGGCLAVGSPGNNCVWHTNNGQTSAPCTAPMNPQPGSFYYIGGANCLVGSGGHDCADNEGFYNRDAYHCFKTADIYNAGSQLHFQCDDV